MICLPVCIILVGLVDFVVVSRLLSEPATVDANGPSAYLFAFIKSVEAIIAHLI